MFIPVSCKSSATHYPLDLFQITDLLRIGVLNMSLMRCENKAARLYSYLREKGRLKVGFSFSLIVSPQELGSCRKWSLWNSVLRETGVRIQDGTEGSL